MVPEVTVADLSNELKSDDPPILIDVRESEELDISQLPGIVHIPMMQVPGRLNEIPKDRPIVIVCRSGARSANVTEFLMEHGYGNVRNMRGGMNAWARQVDPTVAQY